MTTSAPSAAAQPFAGLTDPKEWARAIVPALVFGLAAFGGIELTRFGGRIAAIWPANGILLAVLMLGRPRAISPVIGLAFAANVISNLCTGDHLPASVFLASCNTLEIVASLLLLRVAGQGEWMIENPQHMLRFGLVCLAAPIGSSALAAVGLNYMTGAWAPDVFANWFAADALGCAVVTPIALVLLRQFRQRRGDAGPLKTALVIALVLAASILVFSQNRYPLLFAVFPILIVAGFTASFTGAAAGLLVLAGVSVGFTMGGHGPFHLIPGASPQERIIVLQVFLFAAVITVFPVAGILAQRTRMEAKLVDLAGTDALTGLANRVRFSLAFSSLWSHTQRERAPLSVLMLDIDFFKQFNDRYGHLAGDHCLEKVATVLADAARRPLDLAARYGGEEFVILLPHTPLEGALRVADAIHRGIESLGIEHNGSSHGHVTVSIGVCAVQPTAELNAERVLQTADAGLYQAKRNGRARTEVATYDLLEATGTDNVVEFSRR